MQDCNTIIRPAVKEDCPHMLRLIQELAEFERAPDAVTVTEQHFEESGFGERPVWWAFVACPSPALPEGEGDANHGLRMADRALYPVLKQYVKEMRSKPTLAEQMLWSCISGKQLAHYKFRRQHIIGRYIADFVCLKKRLIVEVDGLYHQLPDNRESDDVRTEWLRQHGFEVIRFTNEEVLNSISKVEFKLIEKLEKTPAIVALHNDSSPFGGGREGVILGFALYYIRYSTWKGQRMYLEDILVTESARGQGIGSGLMDALITEAKRKDLHGISWQVLHWNEPAVRFYERYNARFDPEWVNVAIDV